MAKVNPLDSKYRNKLGKDKAEYMVKVTILRTMWVKPKERSIKAMQ